VTWGLVFFRSHPKDRPIIASYDSQGDHLIASLSREGSISYWSHLLWLGDSVFQVSSEGSSHLITFNPDLHGSPFSQIQVRLTWGRNAHLRHLKDNRATQCSARLREMSVSGDKQTWQRHYNQCGDVLDLTTGAIINLQQTFQHHSLTMACC
jgi:hypothetical protein